MICSARGKNRVGKGGGSVEDVEAATILVGVGGRSRDGDVFEDKSGGGVRVDGPAVGARRKAPGDDPVAEGDCGGRGNSARDKVKGSPTVLAVDGCGVEVEGPGEGRGCGSYSGSRVDGCAPCVGLTWLEEDGFVVIDLGEHCLYDGHGGGARAERGPGSNTGLGGVVGRALEARVKGRGPGVAVDEDCAAKLCVDEVGG